MRGGPHHYCSEEIYLNHVRIRGSLLKHILNDTTVQIACVNRLQLEVRSKLSQKYLHVHKFSLRSFEWMENERSANKTSSLQN